MKRRNTKQRQIILDVVNKRCDHPTADLLYDDIKKVDSSISLGTVYRNLSVLTQTGQISEIRLDSVNRYDFNTDKHNHFLCKECGKLTDIDIEYDNRFDGFKTKDGFYIASSQVIYKGICPNCLKKSKKGDKEK